MPKATVANAARATLAVPAGKAVKSIAVRVLVQPASAAVLIYGGPGFNKPVRFSGPQSEGEIPADGPTVYIQGVDGAIGVQVYTLGWFGD